MIMIYDGRANMSHKMGTAFKKKNRVLENSGNSDSPTSVLSSKGKFEEKQRATGRESLTISQPERRTRALASARQVRSPGQAS